MNELGKTLVEASLADSWGGIALLFAGFLYFFVGVLGYGFAWRKLVLPKADLLTRVSDALLLGSLFLFILAFFLAALQVMAAIPRALYWLLFTPGIYFALPLLREAKASLWPKRKWPLAVLFLIFFVRALTAALPSQHGDPLLYHLLGPRLWVEGGGFLMHPNLPNALLASSWECLYLWPQLFWFSSAPLYGLVEAQLFSQWLHLFLAWAGSALLVMRLFREFVRESWLPLVGLAALFIAGLHWTAPLAKNDVGIAFWVLGAVVFFVEAVRESSPRKALLSGLFAGLAVCGKITALLSLGPLLAALFLFAAPWRKHKFFLRAVGAWSAGFFLGLLPIYARNYFLSGNPFFPLFPKVFPSPWMSKSWEAHFAQVHPSSPLHAFPRIWGRAPELFFESPWILFALPLLGWVLARNGKREGTLVALLLGSFLAYVIFVITQDSRIELRYLGPSLMLLAAGGILFLERFSGLFPPAQKAALFIALIALLASSKLPLHVLRKIWVSPLGVQALRAHSAGEAKAWLRAHAQDGFTVVAGDNETYYLTPLGVAVLTERPDLDAANEETQLTGFVQKLCALTRARYLLDARPDIGVEKRFGAEALKFAKVFSAQGANVYDLRALESSTRPASLNCR